MVHELVISSAQQGVARMATPARSIYHALRMLNAKADRKRLGLHRYAAVIQHGKCVACAVAQRQHDMAGCDRIQTTRRRVANLQRIQTVHAGAAAWRTVQLHIHHLLPEAHFPTQHLDARAQVFHHFD